MSTLTGTVWDVAAEDASASKGEWHAQEALEEK